MPAPILYAPNLLEDPAVAVSVGGEAAGKPRTRMYNRDITLPWVDTATGSRDVLVNQGASGIAVTHWALGPGHNLSGISLEITTSPDNITHTSRDTVVPGSSAAFLRSLGGFFSTAYLRLRMFSTVVAPSITEFFLTSAVAFPRPPRLEGFTASREAHVLDYESDGGYEWSTELSATKWRRAWLFRPISDAEKTSLEAVFETLKGGAKAFWLIDEAGILRWARWLDRQLDFEPLTDGKWQLRTRFREAF
jgi:hypothetical protein